MNVLTRNFYRYIFPHVVKYKKKPHKKYYFVISSGRTGTAFLAKYFNTFFDNICSVHEPNLDIKRIRFSFLKDKISVDKASAIFLSYRWNLYQNSKNCEILIESNPALSTLIPMLKQKYEKPKFLFITRNPIYYVRSAYDKVPQNKKPQKLFYSKEDENMRLTPKIFKNDKTLWKNITRFEKICWYWNKINKIIYNELKIIKNSLRLKFEDVFSDNNNDSVTKMINFFGIKNNLNTNFEKSLELFNNKINTNQHYRLSKDIEKWDKHYKEILIKRTKEMSKVFKYYI